MKHDPGMDVSKAKLDCSLLREDSGGKRKAKSVANSRVGIDALLLWCRKQGVTPDILHVIMEGTGVYHEQSALALCDAGVTVSIVNPAQVSGASQKLCQGNCGAKQDRRD
jgi:transposase